jgi:hypothetical protein
MLCWKDWWPQQSSAPIEFPNATHCFAVGQKQSFAAILDVIPIASRGVFFFLQIDFLDQRSSSAIWVRWVLWFCREGRTSFSSFASFTSCFLLQQQEAAEICTDRKKQQLLQNWIDCRGREREREREQGEFCASCEAGEVLASLKDWAEALLACLLSWLTTMGDSSNSSGSGSSDDGGGRGSEWEVVSLSLSSHSLLSASTSLDTTACGAATGTGNGGGDAPFATALNSAYFLCSPKASSPEAPLNQRPSSSNVEEEEEEEGELLSSSPEPDADADEKKKKKTKEEQMAVASEVPAELLDAEESFPLATTTKEVSQQEDEEEEEDVEQQHQRHGRDALFPVARSCASRMQELSGMDWLEPMAPAGE